MVIYYDEMNLANVLSRKMLFPKDKFEEACTRFLTELGKENIQIDSNLIYCISDVLEDGRIGVNFMIATQNPNYVAKNGFVFDSYFSLGQAVCARVLLSEMEEKQEEIFDKIKEFCEKDNKKICSNMYFIKGMDEENPYFLIKGAII